MAVPDVELQSRYLELLEKSLLNSIYGESRLETALRRVAMRVRHPYLTRNGAMAWPPRAHTMLTPARLRNVRTLVERTLAENIPGDYIETGVWRGGTCILMAGVLAAHGIRDRRVFCADSFRGMPRPDPARYPADKRERLFVFDELTVSENTVRDNFRAYDLLSDRVVFVNGWFKETLPRLASERFALIRLDGDLYESTMDGLVNLYDRVSDGGFIVIDDYGVLTSCRKAVHDFLDRRNLKPDLQRIDAGGAWWQKSRGEA